MNLAAIQAEADTFNPFGLPWNQVSVVLIRYRSQYEWRIEHRENLEADFREAYAETDALAAELTRRGATVYGVLFERRSYQVWLLHRTDTPQARNEWARERVTDKTAGGIFVFTVGALQANEPAAPEVEALYGGGETPIGWASCGVTV